MNKLYYTNNGFWMNCRYFSKIWDRFLIPLEKSDLPTFSNEILTYE